MYENNESEVFGRETDNPVDLTIPKSLRTIGVLPISSGKTIHTILLKGRYENRNTGYHLYSKDKWRYFSVREGEFICGVKGS